MIWASLPLPLPLLKPGSVPTAVGFLFEEICTDRRSSRHAHRPGLNHSTNGIEKIRKPRGRASRPGREVVGGAGEQGVGLRGVVAVLCGRGGAGYAHDPEQRSSHPYLQLCLGRGSGPVHGLVTARTHACGGAIACCDAAFGARRAASCLDARTVASMLAPSSRRRHQQPAHVAALAHAAF